MIEIGYIKYRGRFCSFTLIKKYIIHPWAIKNVILVDDNANDWKVYMIYRGRFCSFTLIKK